MAKERPLKSSFEIAMERLREKDRAEGIAESKPLTEDQKRRIAELREESRAKLAEIEILHRKDLEGAAGDPEKLRDLEKKHSIDRERIESRLASAIAKVRRED